MKTNTTAKTGKCPYLPPTLVVVRLGMDASLLQTSIPAMKEEDLDWSTPILLNAPDFNLL